MTTTDNIRASEHVIEKTTYRYLLIAVMAIAGLALLAGLISMTASADPLPTDITSDMYISGDQIYNNSSTNLGAYIYVQSGGNLTFDNVTINITGGSGFEIQSDGRLVINNTIIQTMGGYYYIIAYQDSTIEFRSSQLSNYDFIYLYSEDVIIDGNSLNPSDSWTNGIDMYYGWNYYPDDGPFITNNSFGDCYTGFYMDGYYTTLQKVVLRNNTFTYNNNYGAYFYVYYGSIAYLEFSQNNFTTTSSTGLYMYMDYGSFPAIKFDDNIFQYTYGDGINIQAQYSDFSNSEWSFSGNYIQMAYSWYNGIYLNAYSSTLWNVSINNNTIPSAGSAIQLYAPYGSSNMISISGNTITNPNGNSIYYYCYNAYANEIYFNNNTIENAQWSYPFYFSQAYGSFNLFMMDGNTVNHSYYETLGREVYGTIMGSLIITNNHFNDTGTLWYSYSWDSYTWGPVVISGNTFTNFNGYIFYCDCYYASFSSFTVENNYGDQLNSYVFYIYMYYGQFSGDFNVRNNTFKNLNSGYYFYIYTGWSGNGGFRGYFNFTDNKFMYYNGWGDSVYFDAPYSVMKDLTVERNVFKEIGNGWMSLRLNFYQSTMGYVRLNNNTFAKCNGGLYYYNGGGTTTAVFVQNNTLINNNNNGIYFDVWGFNSPIYIEHNLFIDNYYGLIIYASDSNLADSRISNNTFLKNQYGLELEYMDKITIADNKINSNSQYGIYGYGDWNVMYEFNTYNNQITGNGRDIYLEQGMRMISHNDTFETTTLQSWGGQSPEIWVMGILDIQVLWEDGTGPVSDAELKVFNKDGTNILDDRVDVNGWYKNLNMIQYKILQTGKENNIPVTINASKYGILNSIQVTPVYHTIVYITLDNVPPTVTLYSPTDMMQTNKNLVKVAGVTEPGAILSVNGVKIDLTVAGAFEYFAPLNREGNNDVKIIAKDKFNNTRTIVIHVFKDTIPPPLIVDEPIQKSMTNQPTVVVRGSSEPGAILKINENPVTLDANGRFEYTVLLTEGENNITILASDLAGNEVYVYRIVSLDSVPPTITIVSPPNGLITNAGEIDVRGFASGATMVKLNNIGLKLLGETFVTTFKLSPGVNTLLFEAYDVAGNSATVQITVLQDANPPQLEVIYPTDNLFTGNEILVVSGTSEIGNSVTVAGVPVQLDPNNGQFSYTLLLKEGTNRIVVRAVDKIGNTFEVVRNVFLDTTPPALTVTNPIDQMVTSDQRLVVEGLTDLNAVLTVNGNPVPTESGAFKKTVTLKEGINRVVVIATDLAGNRATVIREVFLDTSAAIQIYSPADGIRTTSDNITISGKLEAGSILKVNGLDIEIDNKSAFSHRFDLMMGANDFEFVITDPNGNTNTVHRSVIREQVPPPPAKKTSTGLGDSGAWLAAALVGAIMGALMAIILFLFFSRKYGGKKNTADDIDASPSPKDQPEDEEEVPKAPVTKPAPPAPKAEPGKSKEIKMVPPPTTTTPTPTPKAEAPKPKGPESSPFTATEDTPQVKGMSDKAAGGELDTSSGELTDLQKKIETLDAKGEDTTKIKQSLRMAEIYASKNNPDKAEKHIQKAKQMMTELDSSGELASSGSESELKGKGNPAPAPTEKKSGGIPSIPPFPDLDKKGDAGALRKAKGPKDGGA